MSGSVDWDKMLILRDFIGKFKLEDVQRILDDCDDYESSAEDIYEILGLFYDEIF